MIRLLAAVLAAGMAAVSVAASPPQSIESFFDGAVGAQIAEGDAIGATVAVVQDGVVVFTKGYGLANREQYTPVWADRTLFRIGSVSKLFVWVAVLQQVSAGRLDLYADVNTYLEDFEIPANYPVPITLRHLMTHTAGFEDRVIGLFASGPRTVGDFHENLVGMLPARVMMPGKVTAYSNYGAALAAHLVELASGERWEQYVDGHILAPLGMRRTSPLQPLPQVLNDDMANGYWREGAEEVAAGFEFVSIPPAGSISSTADDMAVFMLELLASGDTAVMTAASRDKLFERGFASDPRMNGVLHGPYETSSRGQRIVGHDGDTIAFHSALRLYPKQRMGLFLSFNSEKSAAARTAVVTAFEDRLFGVPVPPKRSSTSSSVTRDLGTYTSVRVPANGPGRLLSLLSSFPVRADEAGGIIVPGVDGQWRHFVEIDDGLFQSIDGRHKLAFSRGDGLAEYLYPEPGVLTMRRVEPHEEPIVQWGIAGACVLIMALIVVWPVSSLRRRGRAGVTGESGATLLAVLNAALLIGFTMVLATQIENPRAVLFGLSETMTRAMWLPVAAAGLLLLQLFATYRSWVRGYWWPVRRIHYTLTTFAGIAFVAWLNYWHLAAITVSP